MVPVILDRGSQPEKTLHLNLPHEPPNVATTQTAQHDSPPLLLIQIQGADLQDILVFPALRPGMRKHQCWGWDDASEGTKIPQRNMEGTQKVRAHRNTEALTITSSRNLCEPQAPSGPRFLHP